MDYKKLKKKISQAIESNPLDPVPAGDMFGLCRELEKEDFDTAHVWVG